MNSGTAPTRFRLDGEALTANWRFLKGQGSKGHSNVECGAAVKADAYGLGAREVVKRLRDAGCRTFFVANWGEAAAIADLISPDQIAVFNGVDNIDVEFCRAIGAVPVLNTPNQIKHWMEAGGGRCHVMLDSGINRLGIGPEQVHLEFFAGLEIDILMSHLACADEDSSLNSVQLQSFMTMAKALPARRLSIANSAGIMLGSKYHLDLTRPGISLYGGIARPELKHFIKPVVHIQACVLQIRTHGAGSRIGYNGTYICDHETTVATCSIGYADGYRRSFSGTGNVTFENNILPVIGRVSMDLITTEVPRSAKLREGDWVNVEYSLAVASEQSGLSQYELLTGLGSRADRVWF